MDRNLDGKTIRGSGILTDDLINSLQNYYGDVIWRNKADIDGMMRGVQATLLNSNSRNKQHITTCPEGRDSWCKWQAAKERGEQYHHRKNPIPEPIVQLLKSIYTQLGSRNLLEKCLDGYTQNDNESLHSVVWKYCPKEVCLGRDGVVNARALVVSTFNDGASSLSEVAKRLGVIPAPFSTSFLSGRDK